MLRKREAATRDGVDVRCDVPTDSIMGQYPTLWEFLTSSAYEDGSKRATGSMLLFVDMGVLKACLNDRDTGEVAFLSGPSLESLLARASNGLEDGSIEWRAGKGKAKR